MRPPVPCACATIVTGPDGTVGVANRLAAAMSGDDAAAEPTKVIGFTVTPLTTFRVPARYALIWTTWLGERLPNFRASVTVILMVFVAPCDNAGERSRRSTASVS